MMNLLPNISQIYRLFSQEERHREISQMTTQTEVMASYTDKRRFNNQRSSRPRQNSGSSSTTKSFKNSNPGGICW